jgi:RNA polymerase sigma-70 factor (ECF subfamily)
VAEECVQDAFSQALITWPKVGVPVKPGAWLTTVARRRAIDVLRRQSRHDRLLSDVAHQDQGPEAIAGSEALITDDRLRLIFTCCHPSLSIETQVALTLRLLCGLTTAEVARAFLVSESTMAARLTRAKKKIKTSNIPYRVPTQADLPERIEAVLAAVHLVFTTGHTAPTGAELMRRDLVERALELARMLRALLSDDPGVAGLLALIVLTDARHKTRTGPNGTLLLLSEQDRTQWDTKAISEGVGLVHEALSQSPAGRFALMAAVAAVHAEAPSWQQTDWAEIIALYDLLLVSWPSPVVALNRAVALGIAQGPEAGLAALERVASESQLADYNYLASARADFLRQLGRREEARVAYLEALSQCENEVERAFIERRLAQLDQ